MSHVPKYNSILFNKTTYHKYELVYINKKTDVHKWLIDSDFFKSIDELNENDILDDPIMVKICEYQPLNEPTNVYQFINMIKTYMFWEIY